jgi:protein TonB
MQWMVAPGDDRAARSSQPNVVRIAIVPKEPTPLRRDPAQSETPSESEDSEELPESRRLERLIPRPMPPRPRLSQFDATSPSDAAAGIQGRDLEAVVQIQPVYPQRALEQELEGHAVLDFTVTERGSVRDIVVVDSSNSLFGSAARDAVSMFLYEPQFVDGVAVAVSNIRIRIDFEILE